MNQEQKDSHIEAAQGSGNGIPPITGHPPTQPHADDNDETARKAAPSSPTGPIPDFGKPPVSPKKLEANRMNAQKSTGPRTEEGKAKAAENSYKHGFFAKRLFTNTEQWTKDKTDYETVAKGIYQHYKPEGFMENFWAEKIVTEALRLARLIQHEQKIWDLRGAFENRSPNTILRCMTTSNRQMFQAIQELERLQAKRKAATLLGQPGPAAASPAEECEESAAAPDSQTDEQPTSSVVTAPEPRGEQSEPSRSEAAPHKNCETNPPTAAAGGPSEGSAREITGGRSSAPADARPTTVSPQKGINAGTKPRSTLADIISEKIDHGHLDT